jgi:hypothetical protein
MPVYASSDTYRHNRRVRDDLYKSDADLPAIFSVPDGLIGSTKEDLEEIKKLAASITKGKKSDYDKAKAICKWVSDNIYYDYDVYERRVENPRGCLSGLLERRRGLCNDYARLTTTLLTLSGIPAYYRSGVSTGSGWSHGFNEAYVDGRWIIIDTTWNSRNTYRNGKYTDGKSRDTYFDISLREYSKKIEYEHLVPEFYTDRARGLRYFNIDRDIVHAVVPHGYTMLPASAFSGCAKLETVTIADSVTYMGIWAFINCTSLRSIEIPGSIESIKAAAFSNCFRLETVIIHEGVTAIGAGAFQRCAALKTIVIPASVESITRAAFEGTPRDLTIYGVAGSYAEEYAREWGIKFVAGLP